MNRLVQCFVSWAALLMGCSSPERPPAVVLPSGVAVPLTSPAQAAQPAPVQPAQALPVFVPVQPAKAAAPTRPAASLQIRRGKFFKYALPQGWRLGEDGPFALTLGAPDQRALTVMVGNAGVPNNTSPGGFVRQKLAALRPQGLRLGPARRAKPVAGFSRAYEFDVAYSARGIPSRGVAKCNIQPGYDSSVMAMTAALSAADQWAGYASWLPLVADQVSAINGAAFGARGIMAQNLKNSMAYAEAARNYRAWSSSNWQRVTDDRNASVDRRNTAVREGLGAVKTYTNPYGPEKTLELPLTYKYYWMEAQGGIVGTNDPSANPNQGSTGQWRPVQRKP